MIVLLCFRGFNSYTRQLNSCYNKLIRPTCSSSAPSRRAALLGRTSASPRKRARTRAKVAELPVKTQGQSHLERRRGLDKKLESYDHPPSSSLTYNAHTQEGNAGRPRRSSFLGGNTAHEVSDGGQDVADQDAEDEAAKAFTWLIVYMSNLSIARG